MTTTTSSGVEVDLDHQHRRHVVGGEPMVFHCHHYNTFLQRTIQDAFWIDSEPFLRGAAASVAYSQLVVLLQEVDGFESRLAVARQVYSWAGFGALDLGSLSPDGGAVTGLSSHYGSAWLSTHGPNNQPADLFTSGWIAGACAAVFGTPNGTYGVSQSSCLSMGAPESSFIVERYAQPGATWQNVGIGPVTEHDLQPVPENGVDYEGTYSALTSMGIEGDSRGLIPAFGVYLTHHYANYYNRISFEFERAMFESFGDDGTGAARPLLVEAGHVCAFNTFGGIMKSAEWDALIRPTLRSREDWVHGITAAVNALGWGRWQVTEVSAHGATFVVHDDYESVGFLAMNGVADHPISYLAEGAAAGIMNLVYLGNIESKPDLSADFYNELFRTGQSFSTQCTSSTAMGDGVTVLQVTAP